VLYLVIFAGDNCFEGIDGSKQLIGVVWHAASIATGHS
jgi:hypothetical protein